MAKIVWLMGHTVCTSLLHHGLINLNSLPQVSPSPTWNWSQRLTRWGGWLTMTNRYPVNFAHSSNSSFSKPDPFKAPFQAKEASVASSSSAYPASSGSRGPRRPVSPSSSLSFSSQSFYGTEASPNESPVQSPIIISIVDDYYNKKTVGSMSSEAEDGSRHSRESPVLLNEFQTMPNGRQNVELFKILTAISLEIEQLQRSTEKRFSALESLVNRIQQDGKRASPTTDGSEQSTTTLDNNHFTSSPAKSLLWPSASKVVDSDRTKDCDLALQKNKAHNTPVILNVGGTKYEVIKARPKPVWFGFPSLRANIQKQI